MFANPEFETLHHVTVVGIQRYRRTGRIAKHVATPLYSLLRLWRINSSSPYQRKSAINNNTNTSRSKKHTQTWDAQRKQWRQTKQSTFLLLPKQFDFTHGEQRPTHRRVLICSLICVGGESTVAVLIVERRPSNTTKTSRSKRNTQIWNPQEKAVTQNQNMSFLLLPTNSEFALAIFKTYVT